MGTKFTQRIYINIVTSSGVYFTDQNIKNIRPSFWSVNYKFDDVTMLTTSPDRLLLSRSITGISFKLIPLLEQKFIYFIYLFPNIFIQDKSTSVFIYIFTIYTQICYQCTSCYKI